MADIKPTIPAYCRVNRVIRDIPSDDVVAGNKRTSLRLDIQGELARRGAVCRCIRCREVRGQRVDQEACGWMTWSTLAGGAEEHFLSFVTPQRQLAGFLRLSLPGPGSPTTGLADLEGAAIIREVHVYGQSLRVGAEQAGAAQHSGLGTRLLQQAEQIASPASICAPGSDRGGGDAAVLPGEGVYARGALYGEIIRERAASDTRYPLSSARS